jgi:hypothetical protein
MANEPATVQPTPATTGTTPPRPVTAAEGRAALEGFNDPTLRKDAQLYARANRLGSYGTESFWRSLPPEVAQAVINGRYEATKAFFDTWSQSIAQNAREGKRASAQALQRAQERGLEAFNAALAKGQRQRP